MDNNKRFLSASNAGLGRMLGSEMPRPAQAGFSLVQVMVGVLILAIAAIGITTLQTTSKRASFEADQRATAVGLAQEIIERMRANSDSLGVYTAQGAGLTLSGVLTMVDCVSVDCGNATMARYDLYEFEQALAGASVLDGETQVGGLVNPTACITGVAVPPGIVNITIVWRGMSATTNSNTDLCGTASGLYDDVAGDNAFRRILSINTFLD